MYLLPETILKLKSCDYFLSAQEEAPTTGHKHIHIYIHFESSYKLSKKIMSFGAHIDICRGSPLQNIKYVKKDGLILDEIGQEPHQGKILTIEELQNAELKDVPPFLYNIKEKVDRKKHDEEEFFNMLSEIENDNLKAPKVIYILGDTGRGKTYTAYKTALKNYSKNEIGKITIDNNFIDVVNEKAKCYIIEEFRPSQIKASAFLQLTDKYGYRANIKGGFITLRPEMLIICSIIPPESIYKEEVNKQFLRRITETINLGYEEEDNNDEFPEIPTIILNRDNIL